MDNSLASFLTVATEGFAMPPQVEKAENRTICLPWVTRVEACAAQDVAIDPLEAMNIPFNHSIAPDT
jgi:hypothetical protein